MIELLVRDACIGCDICVRVCPTDVFDATPGGAPEIARQEDCHTCMICELHCPVDALYVSPRGEPDPHAFTAEQKLKDARSLEEALAWLTPVERVEIAGDARLLNQLSLLPDVPRTAYLV